MSNKNILTTILSYIIPKHKLTLTIDKDIITQAKKQKINLSSFLEIRLIDYLGEKKDMFPSGFEFQFTSKK